MNMASSGYGYYPYHQPAMPYYYNYMQHPARGGGGGGGGGGRGGSRPSVHLFILLATLSLYAAASLYALCESAVESLVQQVRPLLILSPLLLIVAAQLWVATGGGGGDGRRRAGGGGLACLLSHLVGDHHYQTGPAPYGYGRGAGAAASSSSSPWGVALVLVLVLLLVSWQSSFQDWRFFPLRRR